MIYDIRFYDDVTFNMLHISLSFNTEVSEYSLGPWLRTVAFHLPTKIKRSGALQWFTASYFNDP